jgi:hypothetical protein
VLKFYLLVKQIFCSLCIHFILFKETAKKAQSGSKQTQLTGILAWRFYDVV